MSLALSLSEQCVVDNNGITAIQPVARSPSLSPVIPLSLYLSVRCSASFSQCAASFSCWRLLFWRNERNTDCFLNEVSPISHASVHFSLSPALFLSLSWSLSLCFNWQLTPVNCTLISLVEFNLNVWRRDFCILAALQGEVPSETRNHGAQTFRCCYRRSQTAPHFGNVLVVFTSFGFDWYEFVLRLQSLTCWN